MKERHLGCKLEPSKILRKTHKSWEQLRRHDPDVEISEDPTENLFVSNSSVLCGVSLEELEEIFYPFDEKATFTVFPNKRSYSFVSFSSKDKAKLARDSLHGTVPAQLKVSHQPFLLSYVQQLPTGAVVEDHLLPKDLVLVENYITEKEEKNLLDLIFQQEDAKPLKHRAVIHYGYEFDYSKNAAVKPTKPIPPLINQLIDKLVADSHVTYTPDQVTINVYEPGQGIPSHYDTHSAFEDPIVCVSLCSDIVMEFKDGANSARIASVLLKRRSLCLLQGEARYRWKHGIVNRKHDIHPITHRVVPRQLRVSVTLRKIRTKPCQCPFKEFCDWDREGEMSVPSDNKSALRIEGQYVNDVYENIAAHFDETRISGWTAVKKFMNSIAPYSVVYDVGCGNGKYLLINDNLLKIGCDMSQMLCNIVHEKGRMVVRADALSLPFREVADAVLSIAVLHHMATLERRQKMISEILRVLKPRGRACITVWSMDQSNSQYAKMRDNKVKACPYTSLTRSWVHSFRRFCGGDLLTSRFDNVVVIGGLKNKSPLMTTTLSKRKVNKSPPQNPKDSVAEDVKVQLCERLKVHDGKEFVQQDLLVPWRIEESDKTFMRYYHVFAEGEMEELLRSVGGCSIESIEKEQGNYIAVITKN